jgi:hypothetical protein
MCFRTRAGRLLGGDVRGRVGDAEHLHEHSLRMQSLEVFSTTDMGIPDEDLGNRSTTSLFLHYTTRVGVLVDAYLIDLAHTKVLEQAFCPDAERAYTCGVHRYNHERTPK